MHGIGNFSVPFENIDEGKQQTRYGVCQMFQVGKDGPKLAVCSVQIGGYDSTAVLLTQPNNLEGLDEKTKETNQKRHEGFLKKYETGQQELNRYLNGDAVNNISGLEQQARERGADVIVIGGDFNQDLDHGDYVDTVGLESRKRVMTKNGYVESDNEKETTTTLPDWLLKKGRKQRRIDGNFIKFLTNEWKLREFDTHLFDYNGQEPTTFSDHKFVTSRFVFERNCQTTSKQ